MKIVKTSVSIIQNLIFSTIKDLKDYIVITYPLDCSVEIKDKFIHVRKKEKED